MECPTTVSSGVFWNWTTLRQKLVTVGSRDGRAILVMCTHMIEEETQQWEKSVPPMPTQCRWPCVVTYQSSTAVCGEIM